MTIRLFGALLCGAVFAASFAASATPAYAGDPIPGVDTKLGKKGGGSKAVQPRRAAGEPIPGVDVELPVGSRKARATTGKSSKSDTSDRMGGGGGRGTKPFPGFSGGVRY